MAGKKVNTKFNIFLILNFAFAIVTMVLVLLVTGRMMGKESGSISLFLGLAILSEVAFQVLAFIMHKKTKDRIRIITVGAIFTASAILAFMSADNYKLYYFSTFVFVFAMATNQFLQIGKGVDKKGLFTNILLGIVLVALAIAILTDMTEANAKFIALVTVILLLFISLKKLVFPTFRFEKIKLLLDILVKTHTLDVIICLLAFIIAFSFILPIVEESIPTFWDAMWYCFAVITTIGFGDFAATGLIGRILTVILGIYGIVVVAILTSVIVNFYNEVSKEKRDIEQ